MGDYISRQQAIESMKELRKLACERVRDTPSRSPAYARYSTQASERDQTVEWLMKFPAADVRKIAHGRWIHKLPEYAYGPDTYECSECMKIFFQEDAGGAPYFNYCPACGADMRGDQDE